MESFPFVTVSKAPMRGNSLKFVAPAIVTLMVGMGSLIMHSENQIEILAMLAALVATMIAGDRTQFGRHVVEACRAHSGAIYAVVALSVAVVVFTFRDDNYGLLLLATVALYATACAGINLQMAFAGIPNFAGAAFFAVGAYVAAILSNLPIFDPLVILIGGGVSALLGLVVVLPVLRAKGHYAALVTIAFGLALRTFLEVNDLLGGPQGMKVDGFDLLGKPLDTLASGIGVELSFYLPYAVLAMLLFALAFAAMRRLEYSWLGVSFDAIRSDEIASLAFGLSIRRIKMVAFIVGNFMIGSAGALFGMMNGFINPSAAGFNESLMLISIIILGGLGNLWGTIGAAMIILVIPEKLQAVQEYRLLIFALLVVAILRFRPSGIMPRPHRNFRRLLGKESR